MVRALELSAETRGRVEDLRDLSGRAEDGDKEARRELRKVLKESTPEVIAEVTDLAREAERRMSKAQAAGDVLMQEALPMRLEAMRREIAGENLSALELLLSERIAALWALVEHVDTLWAVQLDASEENKPHRMRFSPGLYSWLTRWQQQVHNRYLSSIRELARVRKLQSNTPAVQLNIQHNYPSL